VTGSLWLAAFTNPRFFSGGFGGEERLVMFLLAVSMALTAAGSFRRERETGVMELLLVTPLSERQIIWGRVRGIWGRFLPAVFLILTLWLYVIGRNLGRPRNLLDFSYYGFLFATLPVVGLFFSLRCRNFLIAILLTLFLGLVLPVILPGIIEVLGRLGSGQNWMGGRPFLFGRRYGPMLLNEPERHALTVFTQFGLAAFLAWRLHRRLVTRRFALGRSVI